MNPVISSDYLLLLLAGAMALAGWWSWQSSEGISRFRRILLLGLRWAGLVGIALALFNPGHYYRTGGEQAELVVLLDRSASMAVRDADGDSRWNRIVRGVSAALSARHEGGPPVRIHTFSNHLEGMVTPEDLAKKRLVPDGGGTDIDGVCAAVLDPGANAAGLPSGIVICSDGRQVTPPRDRDFLARARADNIPIYALAVGTRVERNEFQLETERAYFLAFVGQTVGIPVKVENRHMGRAVVNLELTDAADRVLQTIKLETEDNRTETGFFSVKIERSGVQVFGIRWPAADQRVCRNPRLQVAVTAIGEKLPLLLLEGRPGWDTKFLAQTLRQSSHIELTTVNRVGEGNFFTVKTDREERPLDPAAILSEDSGKPVPYRMIIFGKGAEYFLTPGRIAVLRQYLAAGGVILAARGKPYAGKLAGYEELEPVIWGNPISDKFRWRPLAESGEGDIFGAYLPGAEAPVWRQLPLLGAATRITGLRPPALVLIQGDPVGVGADRSFPVLALRRYGQGLSVALNGDGLWQWSFMPTAPDREKFYRDFWMQLILWLAKSGDFLPGKDLALTLESTRVDPNESLALRIVSRRRELPAAPVIRVSRGEKTVREMATAASGEGVWQASLQLAEPGFYLVTATVPGGGTALEVSRMIQVKTPPSETDNLAADPNYLEQLAHSTGGKLLTTAELTELVRHGNRAAWSGNGVLQWQSVWDRWPWLVLILAAFSLEILIRRRSGLL